MIKFKEKPDDEKDIYDLLNPIVKKWFQGKFKSFAAAQLYSVLEVHSRNNVLVSSPTGSGKTISCFLSILNELVDSSEKNILEDRVYAVYVSPLKSLNNDLFMNLIKPLHEMEQIAGKDLGIRVAVRTGDTTANEKSKMLKHVPHILVTTPESLAIVLSSKRFKENLRNVEWCIVDEIHSLVENKRGVHLNLSLERLQRLSNGMCRVGLSACKDYDEYITLANGRIIKIGDFVEKNLKENKKILGDKEYSEINGAQVLSIDKKGKIITSNVTRAWKIPYQNNIIEVKLQTNKNIRITSNDKFLTLEKGELIWKEVSKFKPGEFVAIPKKIKTSNKKEPLLSYLIKYKRISTINPHKLIKRITNQKIKNGRLTLKELSEELELSYDKFIQFREGYIKTIPLFVLSKILGLDNNLYYTPSKLCGSTGKHFVKIPEFLNPQFMRLLGLIASDGHVSYGIVSFSNKNPLLIREVEELFRELFGKKSSTGKNKIKNNLRTTFKSIPVSYLFKELGLNFGDKTKTMQINNDLHSLSEDELCNFISGYLDGDGAVSNKNKAGTYLRLYSQSKEFIKQLYHFFIKLGIHPSYVVGKREKDIIYYLQITSAKDREKLSLLLNGVKVSKLKKSIEDQKRTNFYPIGDIILRYKLESGLYCRKLDKIFKVYTYDILKRGYCSEQILKKIIKNCKDLSLKQKLQRIIQMDVSFEKIKSIKHKKIKRNYVYDISVENNENFIASNIVVHNTVAPLDEVAKFLTGERNCNVIDVNFLKKMDLKVLSPVDDLVNNSYEKINKEMYKLIDKLIQEHKTTLIFTNTRSATERIVHNLKLHFPENYYEVSEEPPYEKSSLIGAHHSSLSKEHRLEMENKLRDGKLKCIVCSSSLELGIDIGYIDLVLCLGSPKGVARGIQRIGRSGHSLGDTSKGRFIVLDMDDLVECSVLLKHAIERKIDRVHIPRNCLDVLAQQILGMALEDIWDVDELYKTIRMSYCYEQLTRKDFEDVLDYLAGNFTSLEDRHVYARIWWDKEEGKIGKKGRMSRVIYMTNIGTIPDSEGVVVKVRGKKIGVIEEGFLEKLKHGDIFVLGGNTYQFNFSRGMVAEVIPVSGKRPTVPSWYSERLPLSFDLANGIQDFRKLMEEKFKRKVKKGEILEFINKYLYVEGAAAEAIYNYFSDQYNYVGMPNSKELYIENYTDEAGKKYLIFHFLFGRRVNDALSRALGYAILRLEHKSVEIGVNDNGFYVSCDKKIKVMNAFKLLKSQEFEKVLKLAIENSEVLKRRFRNCASRALMILRQYGGIKKRIGRQQVSSMILMSAVKRISEDFFILKEARREVIEDLMDAHNALKILKSIEDKDIKIKEITTNVPSPFALNLVLQGYSDILKMEDRQEFLKRMHNMIKAKIALKRIS